MEQETDCPFDVPEAAAPWRGDYAAIARGEMSHSQHQVSVARWALHNSDAQTPKSLERLGSVARQHTGVVVPLFPLAS